MKITRRKSCLILYALFFAMCKPYFIPNTVYQVIKIGIIAFTLLFLVGNVKIKKFFNVTLLYGLTIVISSYIAFKNNFIESSTLANALFYAICMYCIYALLEYFSEKGLSKDILISLVDISGLYSLLTVLTVFFPIYTDDSGLETYLFGNKFSSSYLILFFIGCFYTLYYQEIKKAQLWKLGYIFIIFVSIVFNVVAECSTGIMATLIFFIVSFVPEKLLEILKKPIIVLIALFFSAIFPVVMQKVMQNKMVEYIIVNILDENLNLNYRNIIYKNHVFQLVELNPVWGYGYNNTRMLERTNFVFSNAQNALWEIIIRYGVVGAGVLMITVLYCVKKSNKLNINIGLIIFLYVLIVVGTIEVSYNWFFIWCFSLIRWIQKDDVNEILKSEYSSRSVNKKFQQF